MGNRERDLIAADNSPPGWKEGLKQGGLYFIISAVTERRRCVRRRRCIPAATTGHRRKLDPAALVG
jgi:hypothetical protein